ncbi:MAG: AMP-binding protein [Chloroflexota bacterium]
MLTLATRNDYPTLLDAESLADYDAIAITFVASDQEAIQVTRREFRQHVLRFGHLIAQNGVSDGDLVIIAHTHTLTSIYAFWGAMAIGAIPSMFPTLTEKLDPEIYKRDLTKLVTLSDVKSIITDDSFAPTIADLPCTILTASHLDTEIPLAQVHSARPDSIAFLQHSSGTTGLQKGVALSHRAVLNQLASYSDALAISNDDIIVSWLPLYHDMGLIAGFLLPLIQGIPLVLMSPFDWVAHPALLLRAIDDYGGTLCWLPNFAYNHMARRIRKRDRADFSLRTMRAFINCSEPVHLGSHQAFLNTFSTNEITEKHFAVSYAMAENTFAVTQTVIGEVAKVDYVNQQKLEELNTAEVDPQGVTIVSCGKATHNTAIRIINDEENDLAERHVGEVCIKSDCMLTEYYNRPDLEPFVAGWYRTGDMGYLADGELYIIGRKKDIIINAGKNVYPQDIEAIVNAVDGVHRGRCVVFGVFDDRDGTERIAVVAEIDNTIAVDEKSLKKQIRQQIAQQSTVTASYVTLVDERWLIKTSSGKIARGANREKWLSEFASS